MIVRLGFEDVAKWWNFIRNCVRANPPIRAINMPTVMWSVQLLYKLMTEGVQAWLVWDELADKTPDVVGVVLTATELEDISEVLNLLVYCMGPVVENGVKKKFTEDHLGQIIQAVSDYREQTGCRSVMWFLGEAEELKAFPRTLPKEHVVFTPFIGGNNERN